jgi:hypothetical protein
MNLKTIGSRWWWVVGGDEGRRVKGIWKEMCGINNHAPS